MVQAGSSDIFARHVTRSLYEHGERPSRTDSSRPDKVSLRDQRFHASSNPSGLQLYSGLPMYCLQVTFLDWNRDGSILASGLPSMAGVSGWSLLIPCWVKGPTLCVQSNACNVLLLCLKQLCQMLEDGPALCTAGSFPMIFHALCSRRF